MSDHYWPLFDLRIRTPRLEIRFPRDEDLYQLLALTDLGIHDPSTMPFLQPWTDEAAPERHLKSLQWWWSQRANWLVDDWTFVGAVFVEGEVVGVQDLSGKRFTELRSVKSGSWLGRHFQGHGLGKEMRSAILHFAFEGLGADTALSEAFWDNSASLGTSKSLGYKETGVRMALRRDVPDRVVELQLDREDWMINRRDDIEILDLDVCRSMFQRHS